MYKEFNKSMKDKEAKEAKEAKEYSDKMSKILDSFNSTLTDNKVEYNVH